MLTQAELKAQLHYDLDTGIFTWIKPNKYSNIKPNTLTALNPDSSGYKHIIVNRKKYYAHRLAWLYVYGTLPKYIDHIDGNRINNCISNLREVNSKQNSLNRKISSNNKSGVKGVEWNKQSKKWRAHISIDGKPTYLGSFNNLDDAKKVIEETRIKHHGNFYNHG